MTKRFVIKVPAIYANDLHKFEEIIKGVAACSDVVLNRQYKYQGDTYIMVEVGPGCLDALVEQNIIGKKDIYGEKKYKKIKSEVTIIDK